MKQSLVSLSTAASKYSDLHSKFIACEREEDLNLFAPLRLRGGAGDSPSPSRVSSGRQMTEKISDLETVSFDSESDNDSSTSEEFNICDDPRFESNDAVNNEMCSPSLVQDRTNPDLSVYQFCSDPEPEIVEFKNLNKEKLETEIAHNELNETFRPCCDFECNRKAFSEEAKEILHQMNLKSKLAAKNDLLAHLHYQEKMGLSVAGFFFSGEFLCPKTFSRMSGFSQYIVNDVMDGFRNGLCKFEHGNLGVIRQSPASTNFICWARHFSGLYGQAAPDEQVIVLPSFLKIKDLFEIYGDEAEEPKVKESTFYRLLENYFGPNRHDKTLPCLRISAYSTHSSCDQCIALGSFQRCSKTEEQLALAKSLRMAHKRCYGGARIYIENLRYLAINHPESRLFLQLDDMGKLIVFDLLPIKRNMFQTTLNHICRESWRQERKLVKSSNSHPKLQEQLCILVNTLGIGRSTCSSIIIILNKEVTRLFQLFIVCSRTLSVTTNFFPRNSTSMQITAGGKIKTFIYFPSWQP